MPKKGGGGKKKGGGGGAGGRRGGKGRGKGKGAGAKRAKRRAEREEEETMRQITGRPAAKASRADEAEEEEASEEPQPVRRRPAKPGFNSLLDALGVVESDGGESDEDEGEAESDGGGSGEEPGEGQGEAPGGEGEVEGPEGSEEEARDLDAPDEAESSDEDEEELEPALLTSGPSSRKRGVRGEAKQSEMMDFYTSFWQDPPGSLGGESNGKSAASTDSAAPQHFALPSLRRCEAQRRDVAALQRAAAAGAAAWRRCGLAPGLEERWDAYMQEAQLTIGEQESALFLFLHAYLDVSFPVQTHLNARAVRALSTLHVVDHVLKACREVLENSAKLKAARPRAEGEEAAGGGGAEVPAVADQGFTRPRVLILCSFRSVCYEIVQIIMKLFPGSKEVANAKRFEEEFGPEGGAGVNDDKPADYKHLFEGNADDSFRIGLSLARKKVKLFAPFSKSDILICSPLSLRQITGASGDRQRDFDFLSSIEVCLLDRADVLAMQNWEHVQEVMKVVNHKPQDLKGIDISRLRPAFADGRARHFRQTVVTSCGQSLDAEALFSLGTTDGAEPEAGGLLQKWRSNRGFAKRGKKGRFSLDEEDEDDELPIKLAASSSSSAIARGLRGFARLADLPEGEALSRSIALGVAKQFFLHVPCGAVAERNEQLFQTFRSRYWKPLGSSLERLIVVANSYYNFLRLRRFLRDEGASFVSAFEYTSGKDCSRARRLFFAGERRLLLTTERFLWYRRMKLKGADYALFFGPPETAAIYEEILSNVRTPSQCNSMCLYTTHDAFALERIAGHERARRMLTSAPGKVFVYS